MRTPPKPAPTWTLQQLLLFALLWTAITAVLHMLVQAHPVTRAIAYGLAANLALTGAMFLMHVVAKVFWMWRFHGAKFPQQCRRTYALFLRTSRVAIERTKLRGHAATGAAIGALALIMDPWICAAVASPLLAYAAMAASKIYLPASVVYLATSTPPRLELRDRLNKLGLLNFTSLLDASHLPLTGAAGYSARVAFESLFDSRTFDDDDWHEVVEVLIDITHTVLLDARDTSPGVLHEVRRIFARSLHGKTVFIADDHGRLPALEHFGVAQSACDSLTVVTQEALQRDPYGVLFRRKRRRHPRRNA